MNKNGKMDLVNGGDAISMNTSELFKEEKTEVETQVENKKTSTDKKVNKKSKSTKITQSLADFLY